MKRFLMCLLVLAALFSLLCVTASATETVDVQVTGVLDYAMAEEVFTQLNNYRASNGLDKLVLDADLTAAAMERAAETSIAFSHTRPNGTRCFTLFPYSGTAAENIAAGHRSATQVMTGWKNSDGHNRNMLNANMTHVGIGCAYVGGTYYWVQAFAGRGADNTNDYSGISNGRFLYTIAVLKSNLAPHTYYPSVKVVVDPESGEITGNRFTLSYRFTYDDGTGRPSLVPTAFQLKNGQVEDVIIRDDDGNEFARLSIATDGTGEIIVTPIAENGTVEVTLPCYDGEADPIPVTVTIHTHNLHATVFEPTCQKRGYTFYECPGCRQYTDDYVDAVDCVAAEERIRIREATCRQQGYTGDVACKWCDRVLEEGEWYYGDHNSSDWIIQFEPTETEEGLKYKYCLDCRSITASEAIPVELTPTEPKPTDPKPTTPSEEENNPASNSFVDVPGEAFYHDPVLWAVDNSITNGIDATHFGPEVGCTRAHVVTFLWRANGSPKAGGANPFTDVPANQWYTEAVLWAVENGITNGVSATAFAPDQTCTRGQIVTFLWRYQHSPSAAGMTSFTDVPAGQYYSTAVAWAVAKEITNGMAEGIFAPNATCTRGQIVTFLYRALT